MHGDLRRVSACKNHRLPADRRRRVRAGRLGQPDPVCVSATQWGTGPARFTRQHGTEAVEHVRNPVISWFAAPGPAVASALGCDDHRDQPEHRRRGGVLHRREWPTAAALTKRRTSTPIAVREPCAGSAAPPGASTTSLVWIPVGVLYGRMVARRGAALTLLVLQNEANSAVPGWSRARGDSGRLRKPRRLVQADTQSAARADRRAQQRRREFWRHRGAAVANAQRGARCRRARRARARRVGGALRKRVAYDVIRHRVEKRARQPGAGGGVCDSNSTPSARYWRASPSHQARAPT